MLCVACDSVVKKPRSRDCGLEIWDWGLRRRGLCGRAVCYLCFRETCRGGSLVLMCYRAK